MNQKLNPKKKKSFISSSFKYLIAVVSIAATVGLWGILSRQDMPIASAQTVSGPLPTLATLMNTNYDSALSTTSNSDLTSELPVVTQAPVISGSYSNLQLQQSQPITSSRSSR